MVSSHLVQQADLHPVADPEAPVDAVQGAGVAVNEPSVGGRGQPADLDHVPPDAVGRRVLVVTVGVVMLTVRLKPPPPA